MHKTSKPKPDPFYKETHHNMTSNNTLNNPNRMEDLGVYILQQYDLGHTEQYYMFVRALHEGANLDKYYALLTKAVALIRSSHTELLDAIFNFHWLKHPSVANTYADFLVNLNSVNGVAYTWRAYRSLVSYFSPHLQDKQQPVQISPAELDQVYRTIHITLYQILQVCPLSITELGKVLTKCFPNKLFDVQYQRSYVRNLLELAANCHSLRDGIMELIVDRMIQIDVDLKPAETMDVDQETLFDVELHDQSTEDGEYATKLDEMMELVMIFLNDCKDTDPDIFASLLRAFHRLVVPTNTKCVQFLVFYMASLRPENADHILGSLFANLEDERENISSRRAYSAHLGTLVGRAPFVSTSSVAHVLEAFCSFMDGYVECFGEESPTTNMMVNKHALFYTVFQCACYIISFNHDRLYQASERSDYFAQLRFERVMMCALNPLKVCYPPLMKDFGRIMSRYGIKCGLSIIERNERSFGGGNFSTENALDFFFPYDPACLAQRLKKCALYISPICYGDPDRLEEMRTGYQSDGESDMDSFQRSRSMNYMGEEEDDSTRHPTLALMDVKKSSHPPNDDGLGKSLPRFSFGSTSGSYDPNGTVVSPLLAAMSTSGPKKNSFSQMSIHPLHTKNSFGSKADMSSFMLEDQPCQSLGSSEDW